MHRGTKKFSLHFFEIIQIGTDQYPNSESGLRTRTGFALAEVCALYFNVKCLQFGHRVDIFVLYNNGSNTHLYQSSSTMTSQVRSNMTCLCQNHSAKQSVVCCLTDVQCK